ncbi:MAG: ABC transporter substrate-binding protein [Chloroflexi bacterium]|nr:ABC transporter substrate-binding protein [Chloroflexota bacterium]
MKKLRQFLVLSIIAVMGLSLAACACAEAGKITAVDDLARAVYIAETPERVVSLAPSITEILFALGLGDTVVGVTDGDDYPPEAGDKPTVGRYFSTSLEAILDKDPDLVLADGHDPVTPLLIEAGIPVIILQPKDIFGVFRNIRIVGKVMDRDEEGVALVAELEDRLNAVASKTARATYKPTVYFEIDGTDPGSPWTVGPGSFVDMMISLAGGYNISDASSSFVQISLEKLIDSDPDLIVLGNYPFVTPDDVEQRGGVWSELSAVEGRRIYFISDTDTTSRPGPRIIDGLEEMARIIHPELFAETGAEIK